MIYKIVWDWKGEFDYYVVEAINKENAIDKFSLSFNGGKAFSENELRYHIEVEEIDVNMPYNITTVDRS
jgi:hypothetical protein